MIEDEQVRCPQCGARNGRDAQWCTQCYASLASPTTESPPAPAPPPPPAPATTPPPPPPDGDPDGLLPLPPPPDASADREPRTLQAGSGRFRETAEGLEWSCDVCSTWNPIERVTCTVCAAPFGSSLGATSAPDRPDVAPAVLTGVSLVLPGAGHWLLGLRGAAALRAVLGVVWGLGGLSLLLQARQSGQSVLPAVPLLLGWAVVAAGSANDAVVEGGGAGRAVLQGRTLLWLTLGVVGGTFAAVLVGVLSAVQA